MDLSLQNGTRESYWDGCMLNIFASVAGGENFRKPVPIVKDIVFTENSNILQM